jgi:hypothetical protein
LLELAILGAAGPGTFVWRMRIDITYTREAR